MTLAVLLLLRTFERRLEALTQAKNVHSVKGMQVIRLGWRGMNMKVFLALLGVGVWAFDRSTESNRILNLV